MEQQAHLTREQAAAFANAVVEAVVRHVQDHAAIVRISNDVRLLNASLSTERDDKETIQ